MAKKKAFGSGYFGEWIEDKFGLPAYLYICDQINDPKAISPVNEIWRMKNDHSFQIGNDRLVAVVSNYGYMQVRQDEGGPKFLSDHDPQRNRFGGGFGYLTDGKVVLNTYYLGNGNDFNRIYGVGYCRKKVKGDGLNIDQVIFAPFGDDPIMISSVSITNNRKTPANLRWVEYWDNNMYQFSYLAFMSALGKKDVGLTRKMRRELNDQTKSYARVILDGLGIQAAKTSNKMAHEFSFENIRLFNSKPTFEDQNPPSVFLVSMNGTPSGMSVDGAKFFGSGGVNSPDGLKKPISFNLDDNHDNSALLMEREFNLNPGEAKTLYFAYGYLPEGFELTSLINKYKARISDAWENSCEQWKNSAILMKIADEPWVERESIWHNYYLRGAMTYDNFFKEHILSQGHVYQYLVGFQGAARDPLQHALPYILTKTGISKEILKYTLKEVQSDGEIPYGITGNGKLMPVPFKPSDQELWLLWLASEYVLATRDVDFLDEEISMYPIHRSRVEKITVHEILARCYNHFTQVTGRGKHGLQRLSNGDWNDTVIIGHIPSEKHEELRKVAESVLNSAMSIYCLEKYAEMLQYAEKGAMVDDVLNYAQSQRDAVKAQWTGTWFKRAWITEDIGWLGIDRLWLEPQPWAIIGNVPDQEQKKILVSAIDKFVRKPSKIGAMLHSKALNIESMAKGVAANAGVWPSITGTLIWALSLIDGELAWDEWKKNTLAYHAESYPDIWYGIWSGPDTYNSELSKYPGQTIFTPKRSNGVKEQDVENLEITGLNWTDFPVMNLHPHAWPLYTLIHLIGAIFTKEGLEMKPVLPKQEYEFYSPILGFKKTKNGYSGWYSPLKEGSWRITLILSNKEIMNINNVSVNEKRGNYTTTKNSLIFEGTNKLNDPLEWSMQFKI
ncbi:MAG: GH36-type glycosyl hydrolase domain-containing protein [Promethearchaeota archaeon]